jgi:PleD family two-component response regulator
MGWYVARLESAPAPASSTALGVLIWKISHLYRELDAANARLSEHASQDGLAGIFNRRCYEERYLRRSQGPTRSNAPCRS